MIIRKLKVLGIESTCDETAASIIEWNYNGKVKILSNIIHSQIKNHSDFGGVVPEIAARAHQENISYVVEKALKVSQLNSNSISAIATSCGPGLIGGLIVGASFGKSFAIASKIPFIPINHLEAHILSPRLIHNVEFPYIALLVSGGHTQILYVKGINKIDRIGTTLDDAVGETFDKGAMILKLGWPGGKIIEEYAKNGNCLKFNLPKPMFGKVGADFSFSGLKTALYRKVSSISMTKKMQFDMAASFQHTISEVLVDRCINAMSILRKKRKPFKSFVLVGGVAANEYIKIKLNNLADREGLSFFCPPLNLCTDNAAMVSWAGIEYIINFGINNVDNLDFIPRPRWPLDPKSKPIGRAKHAR